MKRSLFICLLLALHTTSFSQQEFFRSPQVFSKENMDKFYASIAADDEHLFFVAPDYQLYTYSKDGRLEWSANLEYKTNTTPFVVENRLWVAAYEDRHEIVKQFDIATGKELLPTGISNLLTKPIVRNGIMYATGIVDLGCVFAYDLKADTILWQRFLAHGCSRTPYYLNDRIIANAEGDHWIDVRYDGKLADESCEDTTGIFPSGLKCAREFQFLSHDGREVNQPKSDKWITDCYEKWPSVIHHQQNTFILHCNQLSIAGNKLKQKAKIDLDQWLPGNASPDNAISAILEVNDEHVWIAYSNAIFQYNYKKNKLEKTIDLSKWEPHQVLLKSETIWLISRKDGRVYGIR